MYFVDNIYLTLSLWEISEEALSAIARKAAGGMRDAISVLDQCIAFAGQRIELEHVRW